MTCRPSSTRPVEDDAMNSRITVFKCVSNCSSTQSSHRKPKRFVHSFVKHLVRSECRSINSQPKNASLLCLEPRRPADNGGIINYHSLTDFHFFVRQLVNQTSPSTSEHPEALFSVRFDCWTNHLPVGPISCHRPVRQVRFRTKYNDSHEQDEST